MTTPLPCKICQAPTILFMEQLFDDRYGYPGCFDVYRCTRCGFGQIDPEVSGEALDRLYTDYYPRKHLTRKEVEAAATFRPGLAAAFRRWLDGTNNVAHYHTRPRTRVLDIGCGNGASLLEIQRAGAEAFGTEVDRNVAAVAAELRLNIHFGDITTSPWPDHSFDDITMSQLLEHTATPAEFLQQLKSKLKPGGRIIMSFPNIDSFNRVRSKKKWVNWHVPYHMNFFSRRSIKLLAQQVDMNVERIRTVTPAVWLMLQAQANAYSAKEGVPSPVWTTIAKTNQESSLALTTMPASRWQRHWQAIKAALQGLIELPSARWQDWRGRGDSFIVWLTANAD